MPWKQIYNRLKKAELHFNASTVALKQERVDEIFIIVALR